jgi:hypothetical protein
MTDVDCTAPGVQLGSGRGSPCSKWKWHGGPEGAFVVTGTGAKVAVLCGLGLGLAVNGVVGASVVGAALVLMGGAAGVSRVLAAGPQATTTTKGARKRPACFSFMSEY